MLNIDRPRRSVLYMPASNTRVMDKAKTLPADAFIFDLEDAVLQSEKVRARSIAIKAANSGEYGRREILIRVNSLNTPWGEEDLRAAASSGVDGVVIPKISTKDDLVNVNSVLSLCGARSDLAIWAMMETAQGVLAASEIARVSQRLFGFCIGTVDLAKDLQCAHPADRAPMVTSLQLVILAARANGLCVLDGVHVDLNDGAGYEAACKQGRDLGFDGKTLIHPNQIAGANAAFAPSEDDISFAKRIIIAHTDAQANGAGVTTLDGRLIEALHVAEAERMLARAATIAALENETAV